MSVDLHRISTGISSGFSRNGFGSIVSFPSVVVPSYPAAGTTNTTLNNIEYPIAQGGAAVYTDASYPSQLCSVILKNDGTGGTYIDWATVSNVSYRSYGNEINSYSGSYSVTVSLYYGGSVTVSSGSYGGTYYHDGYGGYYQTGSNSYVSYGTYIADSNDGSNYYTYYHDGGGGVYESYYYAGG